MGFASSSVSHPASASTDAQPVQRRFLCPACRHARLALLHEGGPHVARCEGCAWTTDDLLTLIPVRAAPLAEVALGRGWAAAWRVLLFVAACAGAVAFILARD